MSICALAAITVSVIGWALQNVQLNGCLFGPEYAAWRLPVKGPNSEAGVDRFAVQGEHAEHTPAGRPLAYLTPEAGGRLMVVGTRPVGISPIWA
jgi:hypothetical protein